MRKLLSILLLAIFCISLCACQPTPDKPFVESKNDGELEAAIFGEAAPELVNGYDAPETWTEDIDGLDDITFFKVNASVTVPDDDTGHVFLCINAIDGSIIDLDLGY